MTLFRICLLDRTESTTEVRWVSARTRKAALVIARNMMRSSDVFGFELWRENHWLYAERKKKKQRRAAGKRDARLSVAEAATLPIIGAHPLQERQKPFDDPDWLFELKYDGYRGLLYLERGRGRLISRKRREMKRLGALAWALVPLIDAETAILDGEIIAKDASGRPIFLDLMRRPGDASYVAFDLLWLNGEDLRRQPLVERKLALGSVLPQSPSLIEEAIWIPERGLDLFRLVVEHDLEGIVAKRKDGTYSASTPWLKIKNPSYSQVEGRGELFNRP